MRLQLLVGVSAVTLAMSALTSAPALAQATEQPAADEAESPSDGDIVVTAQRTSSLLSKTPVAVSAVDGEGLRNAGITNPTALADAIPSISIDRANGLQITIRGVTSTDQTEKGDPSAAFLLDGVYIARPQAQEVSFFDLDRVEVLRGPQGTLYGRNTTAGVVNVLPARPKDRFEASLEGGYGNFGTYQATAMVNLPVGENVALRGAVNFDQRDSFITKGVASPFSLDPYKKNISGRLSASFDFSDSVNLLVRGDYSSMKGQPTNTVLLSNFYQFPFANPAAGTAGVNPNYVNRTSDAYRSLNFAERSAGFRDNSTWGVSAELNWALSDNLSLTYLGSYRDFDRDEGASGIAGTVVGPNINVVALTTFQGNYWQNSQELRLAYSVDRLKLQVGAYYFKEQSAVDFLVAGGIGVPAGQRGFVFGFPQDPTISKSLAFFGQATFEVTDTLRLTGGIRQTSDDKSRVGATVYRINATDPLDFTNGPSPALNPRNFRDSLNNASASFSKLTWRAGVDFDLDKRTLVYASVSTGYKSGGFNDGCSAGQVGCNSPIPDAALYYGPENLTSYELGFRTRLANNAFRLTGNIFHYDYQGLQLTQVSSICGGPCSITRNAAAAKVDGVELEATIVPNIHHNFNFSVAYLDAHYSDYLIVPGVNFAGRKLDRSPELVASAGYSYNLPLGNGGNLVAGVRTRVSDEYYLLSTSLRSQFRQPGFSKTDLTLTYTAPGDRWFIQGFAKNLEDAITVSSATTVAAFPGLNNGTAQFADPRTYGVRAGFKF